MAGRIRLTFIHTALLAVAAIILLGLSAHGISRAATPVLAPGVESLAIDGENVTAPLAVVDVDTSTPTISGSILPGKSTAVLNIDGLIEWETTVDAASGKFSTVVPEPLSPGTHTLTIDGVAVATFNVAGEVPAEPPAEVPAGLPSTGAGGTGSGSSGFGLQPWLFVLAGIGLGASVFLVARRKPAHQ